MSEEPRCNASLAPPASGRLPDDAPGDAAPPDAACSRRAFLSGTASAALLGGAATLGGAALATAGAACAPGEAGPRRPEFLPAEVQACWHQGRWFRHDAVDASRAEEGLLRARVDGHWQDFRTVALPARYVEWSFAERRARLGALARDGFSTRDLAGPHNACVATCGGHPRLGSISLNTAYKGMGWLPRAEQLAPLLARLRQADNLPQPSSEPEFRDQLTWKLGQLDALYARPDLFDPRRQVSLELFTFAGYFTHTFLNMIANPIASASFLAYPTFEVRAVTQLLHPQDPGLTPQQQLTCEWVNRIHNFVHGGVEQNIACVYHVIEVYDDTPSRGGMGHKLA